jgi:hypothetical protein
MIPSGAADDDAFRVIYRLSHIRHSLCIHVEQGKPVLLLVGRIAIRMANDFSQALYLGFIHSTLLPLKGLLPIGPDAGDGGTPYDRSQ